MKNKTVEEVLADFQEKLQADYGVSMESVELKDIEQRSEDWHQQRLGLFTGSRLSDLMACKSKAKGKDWGQKKWLLDFGDTAITYIIERAIERITGERISTPTTWQMQWGIDHEDEGREYFSEQEGLDVDEVSFIKFLKNAGASPDGKIFKVSDKPDELADVYGFEIKCPATVQSHYKLMTAPVAEGHTYFWQTTAEMLALKTDKLIFATYDPRYPESSRLGTHEVELSQLHADALIFRCIIAEKLVEALLGDMKTDLRLKLIEIGQDLPEDRDELFKWLEDERKAFAV